MNKMVRKTDCLVLAALAFAWLLPLSAAGHTFPLHSDPRAGEALSAPPQAVRIWFDGDLEPAFSRVTVRDGNGRQVDKGDCRVDPSDPRLIQVSTQQLPAGGYTVTWSVVSRDGHRSEGDFAFTVK